MAGVKSILDIDIHIGIENVGMSRAEGRSETWTGDWTRADLPSLLSNPSIATCSTDRQPTNQRDGKAARKVERKERNPEREQAHVVHPNPAQGLIDSGLRVSETEINRASGNMYELRVQNQNANANAINCPFRGCG
ncbi:hypothetical protein CVT26_010020 [Gymnopilus dilepis]|uniref:Uncharacterized protein n=1 Tax=Gymnopilus dilepis TaxID=231916 RepID=A0A409VKY2_9AGAR|nr:hypothetical protein CVT26_010020 [Gymnopilus dilepis]